ncbi:MAG: homocysteine S-methyltransferase family protein [Candidatus Woesearchaeota archaeon]|nr:homocysteine S-methyltransferase family protein [Candidatus Woesearchaeota archaeon]
MAGFLDELSERIMIFSGAMGTELQKKGLKIGECPEYYNIIHPEIIGGILSEYSVSGADVIKANTFGANRIRLSEFGLEGLSEKINREAIRIAREASGGKYVAACIGPTGKLMKPIGEFSFDEAYSSFLEQIKYVSDAGADIILIETMADIFEAKAAAIAAREFSLPIICQLSYELGGKTLTGTNPETACAILENLCDVIGANCGYGGKEMIPIAEELSRFSSLPISMQPNSGIPKNDCGIASYTDSPEDFCGFAGKFLDLGVNIIGGCCGTTPEHIKLLSEKYSGKKPKEREMPDSSIAKCASTSKTVYIGKFPVIIGERINPTGKKKLSEELKMGSIEELVRISEEEEKAQILDVNVSVPGSDEIKNMENAVLALSKRGIPLMIDSPNPKVIEAALKSCPGKPIINSVNATRESMENILPLAKKYGALLIGLSLGENGIPEKCEGRVAEAKKIVSELKNYGIRESEIIIDPLTMSVATNDPNETLKALSRIKSELGLKTSLGISNASFGMPERENINRAFLTIAIERGLDAAIINPSDIETVKSFYSAAAASGRDEKFSRYLEMFGKKREEEEKTLYSAVLFGRSAGIESLASEALSKYPPKQILEEMLMPAIEKAGELFEKKEYSLINLVLSAEAFQKCASAVENAISGERQCKGKIVIATVKGDIHEIGKNLVGFFLKSSGYELIDLGKDVPPEVIAKSAYENRADAVGLSALMTTTLPSMERSVSEIKNRAGCKVVVGGAVVTSEYASSIGADGYAKDAFSAVKEFGRVIGK